MKKATQPKSQLLRKRLLAIRQAHVHIEKQKAQLIQQELNLVNEARGIYQQMGDGL